MLNSLSLGTEVAGTAKISWAILGRLVHKSPTHKNIVIDHTLPIFLPAITRSPVDLTETAEDHLSHEPPQTLKLCSLPLIQGEVLPKLIRPVWLGKRLRAVGEESLDEEMKAWKRQFHGHITFLVREVMLVWYQF